MFMDKVYKYLMRDLGTWYTYEYMTILRNKTAQRKLKYANTVCSDVFRIKLARFFS